MSVLDHLARAAAVLLLMELLVVVIIFAVVSGGLAFGLRWVRGKSGFAFQRANTYLELAANKVHVGTDYAAKPVIAVSGFTGTVKATAEAIRTKVRALHPRSDTEISGAAAHEMVVTMPPANDLTLPIGAVAISEDETAIVPAMPDVNADPGPTTTP